MRRGNNLADFLSRVAVLVIVLIAVVCVFGWYLPLIKESQSLRREIALQEEKKAQLAARIQEMRLLRQSYTDDPRSTERVARERLRFAEEGETIFVFEPATTNNAERPGPTR